MRRLFRLVLLIAIAAAPRGSAHADEEQTRAKVREQIRALRAAKLVEHLSLDETTAAKLFPVLNRYDEQISGIMKSNGEIRREIRKHLRSGRSDDARMNKLVDQLIANRDRYRKLEDDRVRDLRKVLAPAQAAALIVILPEIDLFIERQIRKALRKRGPGARPGEPPPLDDDGL